MGGGGRGGFCVCVGVMHRAGNVGRDCDLRALAFWLLVRWAQLSRSRRPICRLYRCYRGWRQVSVFVARAVRGNGLPGFLASWARSGSGHFPKLSRIHKHAALSSRLLYLWLFRDGRARTIACLNALRVGLRHFQVTTTPFVALGLASNMWCSLWWLTSLFDAFAPGCGFCGCIPPICRPISLRSNACAPNAGIASQAVRLPGGLRCHPEACLSKAL